MKIFVHSLGGLGNQMFQIAYAINIASKTGAKIYIDNSVYKKYKVRSYSAHNLAIGSELEYISYGKFSLERISLQAYRIFQKVYRYLIPSERFGDIPLQFLAKIGLLYNFDQFFYNVNIPHSKNLHIYGYFQSELYFQENIEEVKELLKVRTELSALENNYLSLIKSSNSVAISLRLGEDYTSSKALNVCRKGYFENSIDYINERVEKPKYFIFSDSIDIAKSLLDWPEGTVFIEGLNDCQSLRVMYSCQHFIISNSSFSWWGAYLSSFEDKITIVPEIWYNHISEIPDIYLSEHVKMPVERLEKIPRRNHEYAHV